MVVVMADVDITSLSVEISAESQGAELNIDKLATAISNLRTKGNVTKVVNSLDKLASSIATLKQASAGMSGLDKITSFLNGFSNVNTTASAKSINTVVNAIKKIPAAVSGLNGVDFYSMSGSITQLTNALAPLSILDASNLKVLGSAFNAIGKVPDLTDKLKATDLDSFASSCQKISTALTPLASQLDKVGNAFAKLPPQLSKVVTQANRVTAANEKQRKSYLSLSNQMNGFMRNIAKLVSLKAIAEYLGNAVAKFNDFYEATDLFHNAMGNLSGEADTLISKMQGLLGVDPTKAMTYMATIQSLGTSFGLTSDKAYVLSKNLTQLAYDEGSYWNKNVAETFTAMSSAISGEIEPIRRLGVDLSQARLQQELLSLGFNKQVSSLSQADKAVLRYIAIMKQTANVQGNLAQTIQSPANQIKILKAQLDMLAKSVGSLLYPALKSILPPLIAAVQLIREFVEWVAKLMGVKVVFTDFTKSADSVGGIGDAMDNTTDSTKKAAKALKDYTMGFDELNIIDPTQGSSGSSGGASAGNILGDVDLSGYDMFKQYNEEFARQIDALKQKIKDMLPIIGAITAALALWKIVDFLTDIATAISKMTELQKLALSIATVVVEASLVFSFAKGYASSGNPLELLGEVLSAAFGSFVLWRTMGADGITLGMGIAFVASLAGLTYALKTGSAKIDSASTWIQGILSTAFGSIAGITLLTNLGFGGAAAAAASISLAAIVTLAGITYGAAKSGQLLEGSFTDKLLKTVMGVIGATLGAGAALLLGASLPVTGFAAGIGMTLAVIINKVAIKFGESGNGVDAMSGADAGINKIDAWFQEKVAGLKENWEKSLSSLGEAFDILRLNLDQASADLNDWFVGVGEWWNEKWEGFKTNFQTAWESLPGFVQHPIQALDQASAGLKQWFVGVGEWWNQKWAGFKENWDKAWNSLVDTIKNLPAKFLDYGKNIVQGLIDGINKGIENAKKTVGGLAKAILDKFTTDTGIHSPSKVFEQFGIYIDRGLANGITAALPYVEQAMTNLANVVQQKGNEMIDYGADVANGFVDNMVNTFDAKWNEIDNGLKSDFIGTIKGMIDAVKKGDIQTVAENTAAIIWKAMGEENRKQVKSYASDLVSNLTSALKTVGSKVFSSAKLVGKNILDGITSKFGEISTQVVGLGSKIASSFSSLIGPISASGKAISIGLSSGVLSQFPSIIAGIAGLIGQIGAAFMGILQTIGSVLTSLGIPTGVIMIAGGVAIAAAIAGIVGTLVGKHGTSSAPSVNDSYSSYPGTSDYDSVNGSTTSVGSYYPASSASGTSSAELRSAVHDGCYNAFLDIFQRYGDELTGGKELKIYLDGKQITASVEKRQSERGFQIMGNEVYSY